jgi:signal transduction histidine kinase
LTNCTDQARSNDEARQAIRNFLAKRGEFDLDELTESLQEVESLSADSVDGLNQISELVQSLKDFSRLDRVADDLFDVRDGIEKTLTITRNLLKQGVEVVRDLQPVPEIYCSPSRLNQVFINIVTNAVQAMDGKGTLRVATSHTQSTRGEWVEIRFEDTGCGIAPEHLEKVMDPFFTTKPVGQGTGLGMSIVRQIVDQHDGQILIDSKVDLGTRITLSFPVDIRNSEPVMDDEEAA